MSTNAITPTIAKVYLLSDGSVRDSYGENNFHPLSNVNMIEVYVEDGDSDNILTINYNPAIRKNWATHWFPLFYRGMVEHALDGEQDVRTFAQFITFMPNTLSSMNQNSTTSMAVTATVQQQTGVNLIGAYATVLDLPTSYGDWTDMQEMEENDVIAYVWENAVNGFYKVVFDTGTSTYIWELSTTSVQSQVTTKQYNTWALTVQPGYGNPAPMVELTDEQYRLIWQEIGTLSATIESYGETLDEFEINKQDSMIRFDDTYLGVTIQTDIFPVAGTEETVMGKVEVARDINPSTVSDIPTIIYFHGVVVNTAGTLSIKNGSAKAVVFGKMINGTGKIGFTATGLWVWVPISDNANKTNGLKAYISSAVSTGGQTTNGQNRILTITEVNTSPTGTSITADMGVTWGQHITLASGETITINSKLYSALKIDELLALKGGLASNNTWTGTNAFGNTVTVLAPSTDMNPATKKYVNDEDTKFVNGTYTVDKATKDASGNVITTTYATKGEYTAELGAKADKSGGNNWLGIQSHYLTNGMYFKINDTNSDIEFIDTDTVVIWKLNSTGLYLNPAKITSVGNDYCPSKTLVDGYISAHNGTTDYIGSHPYILALIEAIQLEIDRLNAIGKSWGEVAYETADLIAMSNGDRLTAIEADIVGRYATYVHTINDYVYDRGVVVGGLPTNYHVWKYNGTIWADEGIESAISHASNTIFGLVKGDGTYTSITNGIITVLLSDTTHSVVDATTGLLHYTYEEIKALEDRIAVLEADNTTNKANIASNTNDIAILAGNVATNNLINLPEVLSRYQPTGQLTKASPTTALAHKTANLNSIDIDGMTIINLIKDGNFAPASTHSNWAASGSMVNYKDNQAIMLATAQYGNLFQTIITISGHVYLYSADIKATSSSVRLRISGVVDLVSHSGSGNFEKLSVVRTSAETSQEIAVRDYRASGFDAVYIKNFRCLDLTALGTHPSGTAWASLTANQIETYLRKYNTTGLTAGLHSVSVDEVRLSDSAPNQALIEILRGRTLKNMFDYSVLIARTANYTLTTDSNYSISTNTGSFDRYNYLSPQFVNGVANNKYYVKTTFIVTKGANTLESLRLGFGQSNASSIDIISAFIEGTAVEYKGIFTPTSIDMGFGLSAVFSAGGTNGHIVSMYKNTIVIPLTTLGLSHFTTTAEVESYFNITGYIPFGLTNSLPTDLKVYNSSNALQRTYTIGKTEWPTAQQTYGIPQLPNGVGDYIDGKTKTYWRNVGIEVFDGDAGENWTYVATETNTMTFLLTNALQNSLITDSQTTTALSNRFLQLIDADVELFRSAGGNPTTLVVSILRTRIGSPADGAPALAAFKSWLNTNNLQVQYQRTATDHALTSATLTARIQATATDYASITGALNPLDACELSDRYTTYADYSTVGTLNSLPDGTFDQYENAVDGDPLHWNIDPDLNTYQKRISAKVAVAEKISFNTSSGWGMNTSTNILANGEMTDANSDGLADGWVKDGTGTWSISSGKQLIEWDSNGTNNINKMYKSITLIENHKYAVRFDHTNSGISTAAVYLGTDFTEVLTVLAPVSLGGGTKTYFITNTSAATNSIIFKYSGNSYDQATLDNVIVIDLTAMYGAGAEPSTTATLFISSSYTDFYIDLDGVLTGTMVRPNNYIAYSNAYVYLATYTLETYNTFITNLNDGLAIDSNAVLHLALPNATADTLAELTTYLTANPLDLVVPIASRTTAPVVPYITMDGSNDLTLNVTSTTCSLPGDFEATYPKDLDAVLAAL